MPSREEMVGNLTERVRQAQVKAGEDCVLKSLHEQGLCVGGCKICSEEERDRMLNDRVTLQPLPSGALNQTLAQRGEQYGEYTLMAVTAQGIKAVIHGGMNWADLSAVEQESLDSIATKIARIVTGASFQRDSWHDIGGYAKLVEDRCPVDAATS